MLQIVILAGGLATRLWPQTKEKPKSMIEIAGKPFIDWQLSLFKDKGIKKVLLCLGFLGEQIESYVGSGKKWNLDVSYSYERDVLLGTAGAIRNALDKLDDAFFLTYGDSYLPIDYTKIQNAFERINKPALMTVFKNFSQFDKSNVSINKDMVIKYEKGSDDPDLIYIDYGLLVLTKKIIENIQEDEKVDLVMPLKNLTKTNNLAAFEVNQRFYEIGSKEGIETLNQYLINGVKAV